jgi:hypothetical protein
VSPDLLGALLGGNFRSLLDRLDTSGLQQGDAPTRALVVFNTNPAAFPIALGVYSARFPIQREAGPQPVLVRDAAGEIVPCRLIDERLEEDPAIAPKLWWAFDLLLALRDVPALGWRAYAATYGQPPPVPDEESLWRAALAGGPGLLVAETGCHPGDLPATGSLCAFDAPNATLYNGRNAEGEGA